VPVVPVELLFMLLAPAFEPYPVELLGVVLVPVVGEELVLLFEATVAFVSVGVVLAVDEAEVFDGVVLAVPPEP
jgi:hypothetical protein